MANSGDALSMYRLGFCYDTGFGVSVNKEKAITLYCESAKLNCKDAINVINSIIDEFDEEYVLILKKIGSREIIDKLQARADSLCEEGDRYYFGRDRKKSYEKAIKFFKKAALLDDIAAIYSLGYCYRYGQGTEIDEKTAFMYFHKGNELDDVNCREEIAMCYLEGIGTNVDVYKGTELLFSVITQEEIPNILEKYGNADDEIVFRLNEKAFQKGYSDSVKMLCKCYLEGRGTDQNVEKAISLLGKGLSKEELYEMADELQFSGNDETGEKACLVFKKLAELGLARAQDKYGDCLMFGDGIEESESEAIIWYKKAADAGCPEALYHLGECYINGWGVDKDKYTALFYFKKSANLDFEDAEYEIGRMYYEGDGVGCDYNVAFPMIKRAADKGNSDGILLLAKCYLYGYGVDKDYDEAYKYFVEAIKLGDISSYYYVGRICEEQKQYDRAFEYYKNGAEKEDANCQFQLAMFYEDGKSIQQDTNKALYWYEKSSNNGNNAALNNIGVLYECQFNDLEKAFTYYLEASNQGCDKGTENVAKSLIERKGTSQDIDKGIEMLKNCLDTDDIYKYWKEIRLKKDIENIDIVSLKVLQCAAEGNNSEAQFLMYLYCKDSEERIKWLNKAAEQDNPEALYNLHFMYLIPDNPQHDKQKAYRLLTRSAELGNSVAQYDLGWQLFDGSDMERDYEKAFYWLKKAYENDEYGAKAYLGKCYLYGYGVEKDESKGITLLKESCNECEKNGMLFLAEAYENGAGVEKDLNHAYKNYKKVAIVHKNKEAEEHCMRLESLPGPNTLKFSVFIFEKAIENYNRGETYMQQNDFNNAFKSYFNSAHENHPLAQLCLGLCYKDGKGVNKDLEKAIFWFEKAKMNGVIAAKLYLNELKKE